MSEYEETIEVPEDTPEPEGASEQALDQVTEAEVAPEEEAAKVDLNSATEEDLRQLPGIGPALAASIVKYRTEIQPFKEAAEITSVPGISRRLYESLVDRLMVSSVETAPEGEPQPAEVEGEGAEPAEAELEEAEPVEAASEPEGEAEEAALEGTVPEPEVAEAREAAVPRPQPPNLVEVRTVHDVGWGRMLFVGLLSAILGAAAALLILYVVNNYTLDFKTASDRALRAEAYRLEGEIGALDGSLSTLQGQLAAMQDLEPAVKQAQADIEGMSGELAATSSAVADLRQEFTNMREDLDGMTAQVGVLDGRLRTVEGQMAVMDEQLTAMSGQLETLEQAAARFDAFLEGLRRLLADAERLGGATPTPFATPTAGGAATPKPDMTVIPLPTPTP